MFKLSWGAGWRRETLVQTRTILCQGAKLRGEENNLKSTKDEVYIERKLVREGVKHILFRTLPQKEGGGSTPRPEMLAKKVYCLQYVYTNTFSSIFLKVKESGASNYNLNDRTKSVWDLLRFQNYNILSLHSWSDCCILALVNLCLIGRFSTRYFTPVQCCGSGSGLFVFFGSGRSGSGKKTNPDPDPCSPKRPL